MRSFHVGQIDARPLPLAPSPGAEGETACIVLTTLNAKFAHASFGLRYLLANMGELAQRAKLVEFDINQRPIDVLERIVAHNPKIVGIGVYIWNAEQSLKLVQDLKRVRPDITVVLGGPEVSYEVDQQEICQLADFVITGEADLAFAELCRQLLAGRRPLQKVVPADLPQFLTPDPSPLTAIQLPYQLYDDRDIAHRVIYVEASRGCPFKCEFCLSSLDVPVRNVPLDAFLAEMGKLLARGVRQFKFVDRTFNLNLSTSRAILQFFLDRYVEGLFLHFEMIPDRLPEALRETIRAFPAGALQFEVGIQTFNEEVSDRISRRQDNAKVADNLRFLREQTGVHVHADLIVGLPGEDLRSFLRGFDRLVALRPQEIQVGMLKRLRGTPIVRHDEKHGMVYSPHAPYEVLQAGAIDFATMQRLRRFARYWDLLANSGNFVATLELLTGDSPGDRFLHFSDWLFARTAQTHAISFTRLSELIFNYLTLELGIAPQRVAELIWDDYQRVGRSDRPGFLQPFVPPADTRGKSGNPVPRTRQARHARQD